MVLENTRIQRLEGVSNMIAISASDDWKNQDHILQPISQFLLIKRLLQTWQETNSIASLNHKRCKSFKYDL